MRRIEWITGMAVVLGAAAWLLPASGRAIAWTSVAVVYLGLCVWGSMTMRSQIFAVARCRGEPRGRQVALTFDDGPDPRSTPALLDLLKRRGIPAAFFVIGTKARRHPELLRRCVEEGHLIGNHSQRHSPFTNLLIGRWLREELEGCQRAVTDATGQEPRHYRPPFGLVNQSVPAVCRRLGLELVGWQIRSLDTLHLAPARVLRRIQRSLAPGAIVLLHDGDQPVERVLAITEAVADALERDGLEAVRLDRLLDS